MLGDYPKGDNRYTRSDAEAEVNVGYRQGDLEQQEVKRDVLPSRTLVDKVCARFNICQTIVFK